MEVEDSNSRKSTGNRLDQSEKWKIVGFYEGCYDKQQTADHFRVNQSTVSRILSKFNLINDEQDYNRNGTQPILNTDDECKIEEIIEQNRYSTFKEIADSLKVSKNTILNKMHEMGLSFSVPKQIPQLNESHIQKILKDCRLLLNKSRKNIIYTYESYFQLQRNTQGRWYFENEANFQSIPQTRVCLMVYACICWEGKSEIYIYEKGFKVNSDTQFSILEEILIPFAEEQFYHTKRKRKQISWQLLQDNSPSHCSIVTKQFLQDNNISILNHPPNSLDLNPIELALAILKLKVEKQQPKNEDSLRQDISNSWELIDQAYIQACIQHFKNRIQQVYKLNGRFY
ncbi:hypothetical protein ABPG72_012125 [Tetrahymena utriculariae]